MSNVRVNGHSRVTARSDRPQEVHAGQGHKVGLHAPTILGGHSHLS